MLRLNRLLPLLIVVIARMMICAPPASSQTLAPPLSGLEHWDSTNQALFSGYGIDHRGMVVRGYVDAHQRGADIDIFKDFPSLQEVIVDSLTAGPQGTTLIAAILNFGDHQIRRAILTYDSAGQLLRSWDPAPQYADAIAYSKDEDAVFVLGDRDVPDGQDTPNYPILVEYNREGQLLKNMIPASTLKDGGDSFYQGGEIGQPVLKVTKDRIYFYAPANREVVTCNRDGVVLAYRSLNDIVERISTEDGNRLAQVHNVDFSDDGNIVLELLLGNDRGYALDVFRINIKTGEAISVHKAFNHAELWFVGVKDDQYLYILYGRDLYIQSDEAQEPVPITTVTENRAGLY